MGVHRVIGWYLSITMSTVACGVECKKEKSKVHTGHVQRLEKAACVVALFAVL